MLLKWFDKKRSLNINRQDEVFVKPKTIEYSELKWRNREANEMEFFLDYETMNSNFGKIVIDKTIEYENFDLIFMILLF